MYQYFNDSDSEQTHYFTYDLLDPQTLETVYDSLTQAEAQEIIDKYPNDYLVRNIERSVITA